MHYNDHKNKSRERIEKFWVNIEKANGCSSVFKGRSYIWPDFE